MAKSKKTKRRNYLTHHSKNGKKRKKIMTNTNSAGNSFELKSKTEILRSTEIEKLKKLNYKQKRIKVHHILAIYENRRCKIDKRTRNCKERTKKEKKSNQTQNIQYQKTQSHLC